MFLEIGAFSNDVRDALPPFNHKNNTIINLTDCPPPTSNSLRASSNQVKTSRRRIKNFSPENHYITKIDRVRPRQSRSPDMLTCRRVMDDVQKLSSSLSGNYFRSIILYAPPDLTFSLLK